MLLCAEVKDLDLSAITPFLDPLIDCLKNSSFMVHHLSLQAFEGSPSIATIHFMGLILGSTIQVLLDGGSSDNFIQPRLALHLKLPLEPAHNLKVMVGNGTFLQAEGLIHQVPLLIQSHLLTLSAYVLPISGANIILGASWLSTLGPHIADYQSSVIKFYRDTKFVTLQGDLSIRPTQAQFHHLKRMSATHGITNIYLMNCIPVDSDNHLPLLALVSLNLVTILHQFSFLFLAHHIACHLHVPKTILFHYRRVFDTRVNGI